jgi:hypothetical protein
MEQQACCETTSGSTEQPLLQTAEHRHRWVGDVVLNHAFYHLVSYPCNQSPTPFSHKLSFLFSECNDYELMRRKINKRNEQPSFVVIYPFFLSISVPVSLLSYFSTSFSYRSTIYISVPTLYTNRSLDPHRRVPDSVPTASFLKELLRHDYSIQD